jgi:choline-sulfatase
MQVPDNRPNILVIMSDQHAKRVTGCYGNDVVQTPNIDRLAKNGLAFDNAYCPAPVCVPSRMSFLTGRYPSGNRVLDNAHMLSSTIPTFAHALGAAGYETALMGKMHFVGSDHRHGFEHRPLGEFLGRYPGVPELGGPRWTTFPSGTSGQQRVSIENVGTGTTTYQWFDRELTNAAIRYLDDASQRRTRFGKPFCAVIGLNLPHCPFIAPKPLFDHYRAIVPTPIADEAVPKSVLRYQSRRGLLDPPVSEEQARIARAAYYALVTHVDSLIGEILAAVDRNGLGENTIIIYCADHGEMAGDHGCWWKSIYYEGAASVPLIIATSNGSYSGKRTSAIVNLYDLAPTICDIAGTSMPYLDGRSLLPLLEQEPSNAVSANGTSPHESAFDSTYSELFDPKGGRPLLSRMVRAGTFKLWKFFDDEELPPVLFNLESDPDELIDLSVDPEFAEVRQRLENLLVNDWSPEKVRAICDEESATYALFCEHGSAVRPVVVETLSVPLPWIESDVEIL